MTTSTMDPHDLLVMAGATCRSGYCGVCVATTFFEQPGCVDGHGDLCPEWVCIDCGTAVEVYVGTYRRTRPSAA
jgi:hypothetical protein